MIGEWDHLFGAIHKSNGTNTNNDSVVVGVDHNIWRVQVYMGNVLAMKLLKSTGNLNRPLSPSRTHKILSQHIFERLSGWYSTSNPI